MVYYRVYLFFVLLFFRQALVVAQLPCEGKLRGRVLDENGSALAGALVSTSKNSAVTNVTGEFELLHVCEATPVITVQFLGYQVQQLIVETNQKEIIIHLEPEARQLEELVVRQAPAETENAQTFAALDEKQLAKTAGKSLGESLQEISGVNVIQSGPGIFKPVIHGVHSQRILILNYGIRQEGQQWGAEHAPEIDPLIASNIVVVKDASAIKYGTDALGGVVIVNPPDLPRTAKLGGALQTLAQSNGRMGVASGSLEGGVKKWDGFGWRVQGTLKRAGDFHTPTYSLTNTGIREVDYSAAAGLEKNRWGATVFFSHFQTQLGILRGTAVGNLDDLLAALEREPPQGTQSFSYGISAPRQEVRHNLLKASAYAKLPGAIVKVQYGFQNNARQEFDIRRGDLSKIPAIDLKLQTHTLEAEYERTNADKGLTLCGGITAMAQFNNNTPGTQRIPFIPNYDNLSGGVFAIAKKELDRWTLNGGVRYDYRSYSVVGFDFKNTRYSADLAFHNMSGTLGATRTLGVGSFSSSISSAWRPPHVAELYSFGTHQSAAAIEYGLLLNDQTNEVMDISTANYRNEQAVKWVNTFRGQRGRWSWEATGYVNYIYNYIYLQPRGVTQNIRGVFPYFRYTQTDASFVGLDLFGTWSANAHVTVSPKVSLLRAADERNNDYLIFIPANRYEMLFRWDALEHLKLKDFYVEAKVLFADRQHRAPRELTVREIREASENGIDIFAGNNSNFDFMAAPAAYWLCNAAAGFTVRSEKLKYDFRLSAENIFNVRYRNYTNRLRYYADDIGRNFILSIKCTF